MQYNKISFRVLNCCLQYSYRMSVMPKHCPGGCRVNVRVKEQPKQQAENIIAYKGSHTHTTKGHYFSSTARDNHSSQFLISDYHWLCFLLSEYNNKHL